MVDPLERASRIIKDDPLLAEPLIDIVLWATKDSRIRKTAEYDSLIEMLYAKTADSARHREEFTDSRMADDVSDVTQTHQVV